MITTRPIAVRFRCLGNYLLAALLLAACTTPAPTPIRDTLATSGSRTFIEEPAITTGPLAVPTDTAAGTIPVALDRKVNVYFDLGSVAIDDLARTTLLLLAERLKTNPDHEVVLVGHTDHLGSREYNIALGQKRVRAVAEALYGMGVSRRRIRMTSLGNELAMTSACVVEACKQANRRVELRYVE